LCIRERWSRAEIALEQPSRPSGNGDFDGLINFGDSVLKIGAPANGSFPLADWFTPYDQQTLQTADLDLAAGGVLLLPDLPSGSVHQQLLVAVSKVGKIYLIDRNNMGHFCSTCTSTDTQIVQEISKALAGMWGMPAYWNGNVYLPGASRNGTADNLKAFSFNANNSGLLSASPTSQSPELFTNGPTPSVSANGNSNGIVWGLDNGSSCCQVLHAYDATNLSQELYNSNQAPNSRDVLGHAVNFTVPTIANGKVYVGSRFELSIFGLLSPAATPSFGLPAGTYSSTQSVSIADTSPGVTIYYTTNGSTPTASSTVYTGPISVSATTTIHAIAAGGAFTGSAVATATYTIQTAAATPTFSPVAGTYHSVRSVTLSDSSPGVTIHYTTNGTEATDRTTVAVVYAKEPPTKVAAGGLVINPRFVIPANDGNAEVKATQVLAKDTLVTALTPHMHVRGKDMIYIAHYADGTSETLLSVPKWDFNWQITYQLATPKLLPKGTELEVIAQGPGQAELVLRVGGVAGEGGAERGDGVLVAI